MCPPSTIEAALGLPTNTKHDLSKCLKLLAILILLGQPHELILQCLDKRPNDEDLFNVFEFQPGCTEDGLAGAIQDNVYLRRQVCESQWMVAPVLSCSHHQHFPAEFKAPFRSVDIGRSIKDGAFGKIFVVRIAKGHLGPEYLAQVCPETTLCSCALARL